MKMKIQAAGPALAAACLATLLIAVSGATSNASFVTGLGVGEYPSSGQVYTINPWTAAARANRGVAGTREEGQTFKNPSEFEVGQIEISFDVTGGNVEGSANDTGLKLQIYEVDDVNAASWTAGALVKELIFPDTLPGSTEGLRFTLTGDDKFTLPARSAGTTGYGIVISIAAGTGNPGVVYYTNDGNVADPYLDGAFYRDGTGGLLGGRDLTRRDIGVAMRVPEPAGICLAILGLIGLGMRRRQGR